MKNWSVRFRQVDKQMFDDTREGLKQIETRAATVKYKNIQPGDSITFACGKEKFTKLIKKTHHWASIDDMLEEIPLHKIMPRVTSRAEAEKAYASYPGYKEKIREYGLIGLELA